MHIPDGFLDGKTMVATGVMSAVGLGVALRQVRTTLPRRKVPLLGLAAAFVFAAQMLNFPVAGGTSGHFLGAALSAVLLGPSAAVVVLTCVLVVQCFMFADGGVLVLGANVFNMALLGVVGGYGVYRAVRRLLPGLRGTLAGAAFAGWFSTVLTAVACAGQLALSHTVGWLAAFPAMTNVHMLIGLGEGLITALVLVTIARLRPDVVEDGAPPPVAQRYGEFAAYGLLLSLGLAIFVAPFACSWPDGLEKVAAALGFEHRAASEPLLPAPAPDYALNLPSLQSAAVATAMAGAAGTIIVFGLSLLLARVLAPGKETSTTPAPR
jgi:cobalt/nickel transport system permease protein